ncbi:Rim1 protein [Martiniozyma asiatica (nom. inval.)]|nr:Rim1 protein [Martiniozyma asiatica]
MLQARQFSSTARRSLAKISLIGTIGSDIQKATTSSGKEYLKYSLAVNSKSKSNESTSWFNIACFAPAQVSFMETHLGKGAKVYVEGDATNTSYTKQDGSKAYSFMIFQNNVEILKFPKKEEN